MFKDHPEAIANTVKVAERCNVHIPLGESLIPKYSPEGGYREGETPFSYLTELVMRGIEQRYGSPPPKEFSDRATFELSVIERMNFVDYFLVVWIDQLR